MILRSNSPGAAHIVSCDRSQPAIFSTTAAINHEIRINHSLGNLTTHILDISAGKPAAEVRIDLYKFSLSAAGKEQSAAKIKSLTTNADGRCDGPILSGDDFRAGQYELAFHIGDYFDRSGLALPTPKFIDVAVVRFGIADEDAHYHVPLLVSPFGYSTYRGS